MSASPLLLDTCAFLWLVFDEPLAPAAYDLLKTGREAGATTYVSPISAWEVGKLNSKGRLKLLLSPQRLFSGSLEEKNVRLAVLSPEILIESSFLPGSPPSDPWDQIIAATARALGCTLLTRDRELLDYGEQGYISVVRC